MSLKDSVTNPDVGSPRRIRKDALQTSEQYYLFLFTMITFPPFFFVKSAMSLKDSVTNPDVGSPRRIRKDALQTSEQYYLFLFTMITFPPFFFVKLTCFQ